VSEVRVRPATVADGETILTLIDGLAAYEKLTPPDAAGKQRFLKELVRDPPRFGAFIADVNGQAVGYSIYFEIYSTFLVRAKLYMEDLFVHPDHRSTGAVFALIRALADEAVRRDCVGIEWECLDWNHLAIDFYERIGGHHDTKWLRYSMDEDAMRKLVSEDYSVRRAQ
jgi:GNAT superfamily N-acetyltransferase